MSSKLRVASWILLTVVAALTLVGALASMGIAYFGDDDPIGPTTLGELAGGREDVRTALQARRSTAAAFAAGYSMLLLIIAVVPYRRGERWSWWAVLAGTLVTSGIALLRIPLLGTDLGAGTAASLLVATGLALLLDVSRLKAAPGVPRERSV